MKRRTFRKLKAASENGFRHSVYVVLLGSEAADDPRILADNPQRDPAKPCLYVGMTGLTPEQRFHNHKNGIKSARAVKRYGVKLLPALYDCFNPMPFEAACQMERELADELRSQGYTVTGGS
jgi:predicted GIY-YIG superfamily endonuclease